MTYLIEIKFKGLRRKAKHTTKNDQLTSKASNTVHGIEYDLNQGKFIHICTDNGSFSYSCDTIRDIKFKEL